MIFTKKELESFLEISCNNNTLSHIELYNRLIEILSWDDEDPRDINNEDIDTLIDIVASDVDLVFTKIENVVRKSFSAHATLDQ